MSVKLVNQIKESNCAKIDDLGFPFLSREFLLALEESGSVGQRSGWDPVYFCESDQSLLFSFIKDHSYGEYIFDWDWANFYHQYNVPYYPKLTSMIPFTSATTPHFLGSRSENLMKAYEKYYLDHNFSSSHFLFLTKDELDFFASYDYIIRDSFQYHFFNNDYASFEDFLSKLKSKKAKQIRKERSFTENIKLSRLSGDSLTTEHANEMYSFYLCTITNKEAIPYLTKEFFVKVFDKMKHNILYVQAKKDDVSVAGALYFLQLTATLWSILGSLRRYF